MPTARFALRATAVGTTIYAFGGHVGSCNASSKVEAFDAVTGTWSTKTPVPTPRLHAPAVTLGGKIYVMGGLDCTNMYSIVEVYDPAANTWSTAASMPRIRRLHAAAELGGKIYVVGGVDENFNHLTDLDVYDPVADQWTTLAPAPRLRHQPAAAALDGMLYVIGGDGGTTGDPGIMVYDPVADAWSTRNAKFPERRRALGAAVLNGVLYAIGATEGLVSLAKVDEYDPATDAWISRPSMLQARGDHGVAVAGGKIYAMGGLGNGLTFLSSAEAFGVPVSDATAPNTTAAASPPPNAAGWNNSDVEVKLTAADEAGGSGVKSITYKVSGPGGVSGATVNANTATIPVSAEGVSTIAYFATDNAGNAGVEKKLVVRVDKTAPTGTLSVAPGTLWPPNQRMVTITPSLSAADASGMPVTVSGIAVSSNEPQSAAGDWTISQATLQLRAAREGRGSGRIYTVTYTLTDIAGNSANVSATVAVPHDRGR